MSRDRFRVVLIQEKDLSRAPSAAIVMEEDPAVGVDAAAELLQDAQREDRPPSVAEDAEWMTRSQFAQVRTRRSNMSIGTE